MTDRADADPTYEPANWSCGLITLLILALWAVVVIGLIRILL